MRYDQALKNIYREDTPVTRNVKITEKVDRKNYLVEDVHGRSWKVTSENSWKVDDYVLIQFDRIISAGEKFSTPEQFEV